MAHSGTVARAANEGGGRNCHVCRLEGIVVTGAHGRQAWGHPTRGDPGGTEYASIEETATEGT